MICPNCGTQIAENAKFCDACGTQTTAEQADILARQEKNRRENPPAYLDVKTAAICTVIFFVIMPGACFFAEAPLVLGFISAAVLGALFLFMGIRNQFFKK